MEGKSGLSRARLHQELRNNTWPAPVDPFDLDGVSDGDTSFTTVGVNFTPSTGIVFVPDAATTDVAAVTAVTVVPSGQDSLGSISVDITFSGIVPATADLFQMYLTGPNGQRSFLGTVSS